MPSPPFHSSLSGWLKSIAVWWVGRNTAFPSFPKFCFCQLVLGGLSCLISYFPLLISCLHVFLCQGHLQSCKSRIDLSTRTINMKCSFLLNQEQCCLCSSYILQSTAELKMSVQSVCPGTRVVSEHRVTRLWACRDCRSYRSFFFFSLCFAK